MTEETVETDIGTAVVETPKRVRNPVTERTEDMRNLSADGYCRRFLAVLSASSTPSVVNLDASPVATFDKDKWRMEERDGRYVLVKRDTETKLDELVLEN